MDRLFTLLTKCRMRKEFILLEPFEKWLASYLEQKESQVAQLLKDKTATRFLITWSIFESDCFEGDLKINKFNNYAQEVVTKSGFDDRSFKEMLSYFHNRYRDKQLYKNLMHKQKCDKLTKILAKDIDSLDPGEGIFFLVFVVYRYRNNIFHGNKGVSSWLQYKPEIEKCISIMQILIDLAKKSHNKALKFENE